MIFTYKGYDRQGRKIKSHLEAQSLEEAKAKLRANEIIYTSIKENKHASFSWKLLIRKEILTFKDLAIISRDLSIYISSGISIVSAIKLATNQYKNHKKHTLFFNSIGMFLDEGKNFFQALELQNVYELPTFYKQSIKVSENSGILGEVLLELSLFLKEQDRIKKQVQNAFAYPSFIFFISIGIVIFMMAVVVPKITLIFKDLNQTMPPITQFIIDVGEHFSLYWHLYGISLLFLILTYLLAKKNIPSFAFFIDPYKLKMPLFGAIIYKNEMGRVAYIAYILIRSGVPFAKTINLSSKILDNLFLQRRFEEASKRVVEGDKLSSALYKSDKTIDASFIQAIALGEETSQISIMFSNLSKLYFEENKDRISIVLALLEPALMLFVGVVVGFIVSAMLLPIFSINIG